MMTVQERQGTPMRMDVSGMSGPEVTPGRRAACAVIEQAVSDIRRCERMRDLPPSAWVDYITARLWIASENESWPYSFRRLSDAIGLDVDMTRRQLGIFPGETFFGATLGDFMG